jgi:uncharacterized protein (DUF302 family)
MQIWKLIIAATLSSLLLAASPVRASGTEGMVVLQMQVPYDQAWLKLKAAIQKRRMGIVSRASASAGAKSRGITIPGNMVIGVFRNDFAVRMLATSVEAGIEAPLRFYLTENSSNETSLRYQQPSATFAPYPGADLKKLASELDDIFADIAAAATK